MKTVLKVAGMHCPSCEMLIEDILGEEPGVKSSKADYRKGEVSVDFDEKKTSLKKVKDLITKEAGYKLNG